MKKHGLFITGEQGMLATAIKSNISEKYIVLDFSDLAEFNNEFHFVDGKRVKKNEVDFTNRSILSEIGERIIKADFDDITIIHTGAYVNTDKCDTWPYESVKSNIYGTQLLIELAEKVDANFIHFSTTAIYDPDKYMLNNGEFDETCIVSPKTLYGLTKYNSEISVIQSKLKKFLILQPVFIYGDCPNDNSSMIRKISERIYRSEHLGQKFESKLNVDLDIKYRKDYMRVEGFANMFNTILDRFSIENCSDKFIISRDKPEYFSHYLRIICEELEIDCDYAINRIINLRGEKDYLKDHIGKSKNFYSKFRGFNHNEDIFDDRIGIKKTIESVKFMLNNN